MLVEAFLVIAALHVVEPAGIAPVMSRINASLGVDLDTEGVAASLGKDLVPARLGVISPDQLAHGMAGFFAGIEAGASHVAGDGRPLGRVEPAVGAPAEAVHDRVRVFEAESLEVDLGVAVGHVVVVAVRVEEKVRRVEHPHAASASCERGDDVQPIEKRLVPVEDAVAVGIFVNRDLVFAAKVVRRRGRDLVVDGAPDAVVADHLQSGGEGILQVLNDPEPASFVERDRDGLANDRLGQNQIELEITRNLE